jgi:hypothetical protein
MNENIKNDDNISLGSPIGTSYFKDYKSVFNLYNKLSNCGTGYYRLVNKKTGETVSLPVYCDNRVCTNPNCKKHRLYQYMRKHEAQIIQINYDMRKPKAWVFTTERKPFPIDRDYCRKKFKQLNVLLRKDKHQKYGSKSKYSIHMEIKLYAPSNRYPYETWYLHFHVTSALIENLRLVRKLWGYQIFYEKGINSEDLSYYVSKYASKVPFFPSRNAFMEYAGTVYKLKMHSFGGVKSPNNKEPDWILFDGKFYGKGKPTFREMMEFFDNYDIGGG